MKKLTFLCFLPVTLMAGNDCGPNMDKALVGGGCVCPIGTDFKYGMCVQYGLPEFAVQDEKGGWRCISGYALKNKQCVKIESGVADSASNRMKIANCDLPETSAKACHQLPQKVIIFTMNKQVTKPSKFQRAFQ